MESVARHTPRSPLSDAPPRKLRDLPKSFLLRELETYYNTRPPDDVVDGDYELYECAETGFQFAWPQRPGSAAFYNWVTQFPTYYPGLRWEYGRVGEILQSEGLTGSAVKVLDVGCGKGDFLKQLRPLATDQKYALDMTPTAIAECERLGFHAFCGTIDVARGQGFVQPSGFEVVTSFHCLEHVEDPVGFARSLTNVLAPGGRAFISTPYSPMSFEVDWFDVMNHPPHHLGRWNLKAYQKLADMLGATMRYFVPPAPALRRALGAFRLREFGQHAPAGRKELLGGIARHPLRFTRDVLRQVARKPIAADVILVELRPR